MSVAPAQASRLRKVWRRTWIGTSMIGVLTALFLILDATGSALPILVVAGAVLLAALREVGAMGSLAGRGLPLALLPGAWFAVWSANAAASGPLWPAFVAPLLATLLAYTGRNLLVRARFEGPLGVALVLAAVCGAVHFVLSAGEELGAWALLVLTALALCTALWTSPLWAPGRPKRGAELLVVTALALWVLPPLPGLVIVWTARGLAGLVALFVLSKVGDIAAYYVGNAIGRRKIAPRISPGKTVEGCAGSLVAGVVAGWACVAGGLLPEGPLGSLTGPVLGGITNLAAQAGDLVESWVKRRAGVKDSAATFGPAGGVLDLVDSLLLTVPVALLVWPAILGPLG